MLLLRAEELGEVPGVGVWELIICTEDNGRRVSAGKRRGGTSGAVAFSLVSHHSG